jgi:hypothetical protein
LIYLIIMVVVAAAGIARLWLQQRRQQARLYSVTEFRTGLEKMSPPERSVRVERRPVPRRPAGPRKIQPLDPARRAAAKKRLEARRAERTRVAG